MPRIARGRKPIGRRHKKGLQYKKRTELHVQAECQDHQCRPASDIFDIPDFFLDICDTTSGNTPTSCSTLEEMDPEGSYANEFYLVADQVIKYSPETDVDQLYAERMLLAYAKRYSHLLEHLKSCSSTIQNDTGFILINSNDIRFVQLYDGNIPGVKSAVTIERNNFKCRITVHRQPLGADHELWNILPETFCTSEDVCLLLNAISQYAVCIGNPDFSALEPGVSAFVEPDFGAVLGNFCYSQTVRRNDCELLVCGIRCSKCQHHRATLRKKKWLKEHNSGTAKQPPLVSRRTPHSKMSKLQLCEKVDALQKERRSLNAEITSLRKKLSKVIESSDKLNDSTSTEIFELVKECSQQVATDFPDENSFQRLFWAEQIKFNSAKKPCGMRWHPMVIKWCLQIKSRSSKAYETLRNIGCIKLPNARTLFDYSNFMESKCDITVAVLKHLKAECNSKGVFDSSWKQFVGIIHDEMKVKEDLVYNKHTGELTGFIDLDKTGNQLLEFQNKVSKSSCKLASHMLVLMVRGIATGLKYPLACYATDGVTSEFLYSAIWKAVEALEVHIGLKVMFVTCDGASTNRKFISLHDENGKLTHCTVNVYAPERKLYFISDAPHLLKTVRNCFANSYSHTLSRKLWKDGKLISWMHIVDLYNQFVRDNLYTHCPKLTRRHIDLDSHSRMNVSLAAQVLSSSVAQALEYLYGDNVSETIKFVRLINKFFDCMNTRNLYEGRNKRNVNINPYISVDDERLHWLQNDFLNYFKEWDASVAAREGDFSDKERKQMKLSVQTLDGLTLTVKSVVELVKYLLSQGVPFVLTNVFNQDPLEQQFGHCRHIGGSQDNPTVSDVRHSINRLRVLGSSALHVPRGNTKEGKPQEYVDSSPLPKRRKP